MKIGITLNEIKIIQNYEIKNKNTKATNAKRVWANHPSRFVSSFSVLLHFIL